MAAKLLTGWTAAIALLAAHFLLAVTAASGKTPTFDEAVHLTSGVSYWRHNDYRLQPANGNLPQRWVALPVAFDDSFRFPSRDQAAWRSSLKWHMAHQFFYRSGNDWKELVRRGRAFAAILSVLLLLVVYLWSRVLFGPAGAMLALLVGAFSPNLLGYGPLMTSDLALTLMLVVAASCQWIVLHRLTIWTVVGSCIATGLLFVTKATAIVIIPVGLLLVLTRLGSDRPIRVRLVGSKHDVSSTPRKGALVIGLIALHLLVSYGTIWAAYGFRYEVFARSEPGADRLFASWSQLLGRDEEQRGQTVVGWLRDSRLLPEAFLYQIQYSWSHGHRHAFLNGEHRTAGWWYFFPYCLLVKTPLSLFVLLVLSCVGIVKGRAKSIAQGGGSARGPPMAVGSMLYTAAPLLIVFAVYWIVALRSPLNIGYRHLLPILPVLFVLAGGAATWLVQRGPLRVVAGLAVLGLLVSSVWVRPHYLTYFNLAAGGPREGYKHLVDSSLDWGQDLDGLRAWLEESGHGRAGGGTRVYLSYFGSADPPYHGLRAGRLPSMFEHDPYHINRVTKLRGGLYCISATMLQNIYILPNNPGGLPTPLPWRAVHEAVYRQLRGLLETTLSGMSRVDLERRLAADLAFRRKFRMYDQLRFARLCAALRERPPDQMIGNSILVFRLSDGDVQRALNGPSPVGK